METEWKKAVMRLAHKYGMCRENFEAVLNCKTKSELIAIYKKTVDWALELGCPTIDEWRKYFSDTEADGVFVDRSFDGELLDAQQVYVFHHCTGTIRVALNYDMEIIPMLYFANGCDMTITCEQKNFYPIRVPLYIFGDNKVRAENDGNANYVLYEHKVITS